MFFSIRARMLMNILQLSIPLCFFAWLLVQEVQKQIDFAQLEIQGITMQSPLIRLLQEIHQDSASILSAKEQPRVESHIAESINKAETAFQQVGRNVGFSNQQLSDADKTRLSLSVKAGNWNDAFQEILHTAKGINGADAQLHSTLAAAIKTLITRASDGSNLTLDPDLDSYYVMDAVSFAIPNAMDNLGRAQEEMLHIAATSAGAVTKQQSNALAVWKNTISNDDTARIVGSISTALSEDANFYGKSEGLDKLSTLVSDYEEKQSVIIALIDQMQNNNANLSTADISEAFKAAHTSLAALTETAQQEMLKLLQARIAYLNDHAKNLLMQGGGSLLVGLILFWIISRSIVVPIKKLESVMSHIAAGDINIAIPYTKRRDEIGRMARTVGTFQKNSAAMQGMAKDFESSIKQVVEIVSSAATELHTASGDLTRVSGDGHTKVKELSTDITSVATNMQMIATAGEQLYGAIHEISGQVTKTTTTTNQAVAEATNVKQKADSLLDATQRISGIVNIINGIAAKITLLALNATIEAARAGEVGKGFAVVAGEVKALATQTASATSEIGELVESIQSSSKETAEAIGSITTIIDSLNQVASIVAAAVEEQGVVTKDISNHIMQATKRIDTVNQNVSVVTAASSHSATAATQTLQASNELSQQAEVLRSKVQDFMSKLVAA